MSFRRSPNKAEGEEKIMDGKGAARKNGRRGFTLIEVVIVTAIVAVISLAIYSILSNGLRIWKRVNEPVPEEDVSIFFEKFSADVRTAFVSPAIGFSGAKTALAMPVLAVVPRITRAKTVAQASYLYDPAARAVRRLTRDFSHMYRDDEGYPAGELKGVRSVEFSFYSYDDEKKEYQWMSEWKKEGLPRAVRMTLVTDEQNPHTFVRTVSFPAGG